MTQTIFLNQLLKYVFDVLLIRQNIAGVLSLSVAQTISLSTLAISWTCVIVLPVINPTLGLAEFFGNGLKG